MFFTSTPSQLNTQFETTSYIQQMSFELKDNPTQTISVDQVGELLYFLGQEHVFVSNRTNVENFLRNHSGLIKYLYEVPREISKTFGKVGIVLSFRPDMDSAQNEGNLYVYIETTLNPTEARVLLKQIRNQWLFSIKDKEVNSINLTLDYK